jgi:hypothetical protein
MGDNKLELVIEVDAAKGNANIKSINDSLSGAERAAVQFANNGSAAMDVKGATAGNLLADSIKSAVTWIKEWSIGAAQAAAHVERLQAGMMALSRANGVSSESSRKAVEAIKAVGFAGADAVSVVNRLIVSGIGTASAQTIATMAKDIAAVGGTTRAEAADALVNAIEYGNARALRRTGLPKLDFESSIKTAEDKSGYKLTEEEKVQVRLNEVLKEGVKIKGAGVEMDKTAEGQAEKLRLEIEALKESIGKSMQGEFKSFL